jgi:hypothetical protein
MGRVPSKERIRVHFSGLRAEALKTNPPPVVASAESNGGQPKKQ